MKKNIWKKQTFFANNILCMIQLFCLLIAFGCVSTSELNRISATPTPTSSTTYHLPKEIVYKAALDAVKDNGFLISEMDEGQSFKAHRPGSREDLHVYLTRHGSHSTGLKIKSLPSLTSNLLAMTYNTQPIDSSSELNYLINERISSLSTEVSVPYKPTNNSGMILKEEPMTNHYDIANYTEAKSHNRPVANEAKVRMQGWALVVGISNYRHTDQDGLANLIYADDDAIAFSNLLKKMGWKESHLKILVNEQATRRNIMIALESWLTKVGESDTIVLFWAGHGYPDPEDPEKVYFACHDTEINIPATGYRMDRVRDVLEEKNARNVVIFADTCHAGKIITRGGRGISIVPQLNKMRRDKTIPDGWIFMVGADADRQAIEHTSWSNGAFTRSLVDGLSGSADGYESIGPKDEIVTMGELRAYLNTTMPDTTLKVLGVAKRPLITTSTGDPDIWDLTLQFK